MRSKKARTSRGSRRSEPVHERELLRGAGARVVGLTYLAAMLRARVAVAHALHHHHVVEGELAQQLGIGPSRRDRRPARGEVALDDGARGGAYRRRARESVDRGHVGEEPPHALAPALAVRRRVLGRVGIEALATEEVNLLQLREEARARVAARGALELVHLEVLVLRDVVRIERVARVEMAGDHQRVALHAALARAREPVVAALLHQLHELVLAFRQVLAERLALVGRVHRNGADGFLLGVRRGDGERREQGDCKECKGAHSSIVVVPQR